MVADVVVQVYTNAGATTPSIDTIDVEEITDWLTGITKPVHPELLEEVHYSSKFVDLTSTKSTYSRHGHAEYQDLSLVRDTLKAMGFDPAQIVVENDTIDFNIHYPTYSLSVSGDTRQPILPLYSIADVEFGICWTWDPASCSTRGIIWYCDRDEHNEMRGVLSDFTNLGPLCNHPLLLAILVLKMEINTMQKLVSTEGYIIRECQLRTGHHRYRNTLSWPEEGGDWNGEDSKLNLERMSREICGGAVNITNSVLFLQRLVQLADFVLDEVNSDHNRSCHLLTPDRLRTQQDTTLFIIRQTDSARRQAQGLLEEAQAWKYKSSIVVQTLLSLTTQRDQNISIKIARQATRDSTSMKAIAAVTMCFLPGTFVSALFAVPFINWHTDPSGVFSLYFWVYWAVTLPLTCIVVVVWLTWTQKSLKKIPSDEEKAWRA